MSANDSYALISTINIDRDFKQGRMFHMLMYLKDIPSELHGLFILVVSEPYAGKNL